jgi:hypothetical protein
VWTLQYCYHLHDQRIKHIRSQLALIQENDNNAAIRTSIAVARSGERERERGGVELMDRALPSELKDELNCVLSVRAEAPEISKEAEAKASTLAKRAVQLASDPAFLNEFIDKVFSFLRAWHACGA